MKEHYGFAFDTERCVQCHACEVACKSYNNIEPGIAWRKVTDLWKGEYPDPINRTISFGCMHCAEAACEAACPAGAIYKRSEDGIVLVDPDRCIGCHSCFLSCPFGVPQFGSDGTMQKCNFCVDRLSEGKEPACVATCPTNALQIGPMRMLTGDAMATSAKKIISTILG